MPRQTEFKQTIADEICERIADGESLRKICESEDMPAKTTVFRWLADERFAAFRDQYARAREAQADVFFEEIIDIADDGSNDTYQKDGAELTNHDVIARSRLRVDARKWAASKLAPKKYGEKLDLEHSGGVKVEQIRRTIVDPRHPDG